MPKIRLTPGRFGPVAPGIGAGLQAAGQALGKIADVRTNLELLDIREQEQIGRLEQVQFEKVERSNAIAEFTAKQIWRNVQSERILSEAREGQDFGNIQGQMSFLEKDYDAGLFEGRSQEFRDTFETIDRSARVGLINKLGTAIQVGNLGIIRDNYQIASDNFVESVNAFTSPAEINDFFDTHSETGVNMGLTRKAVDATSGQGRRDAMERHIRSLPLIEALGALSDEDVAKALGEDRRERMLRDLNTKANRLQTAQERFSAVHERTTGIDLLSAFVSGEPATSIASRIRGDENISPIRKKDMLDQLDIMAIAREKGPQPADPEVVRTNEALAFENIKEIKARVKAIQEDEDKEQEDKDKEILVLSDRASAILQDAMLKSENGLFRPEQMVPLAFDVRAIAGSLFIEEEIVKLGFFARFAAGDIFSDPNTTALRNNFRAPTGIVSERIDEMNAGKGRYGSLPSQDKATMGTLLIEASVQTPGFSTPIAVEEANIEAQKLFEVIEKRFLIEEKGVAPENVEEVGGLMLNSGAPATEPRQQLAVTGIADSIRKRLGRGDTVEQIEEFARTRLNFSQSVFDRALATVGVSRSQETALSGELGTLRGESGTVSTEISVTVTDPRLNDGKPTNIPTLVAGQVDVQGLVDSGQPTDEQVGIAIDRAIERQKGGALLPFFQNIEQAERAAIRRHENEARRTGR